MTSREDVILIPDGTNHNLSLPAVTCLKQAVRARIHVVSTESNRVRYSRYCDCFHYSRAATDEERARELQALACRHHATVLFPLCQEGIRVIQSRRDLFRDYVLPPLPSVEQLELAGDKGRLALFLAEHGIDSPKGVVWEPRDGSAVRELEESVFPVLFKPVDGAGGKGIRRFSRPEDLSAFLDEQRDVLPRAVIQEFIYGYDIDCSVLCVDGRIVAYTIQRPIHLDDGYEFSRTIRFLHDPGLLEMVSRLMAILRWNGVAHVDMRYCEKRKKACVIEINPRYWGTLLGSMVAGVNFPYLALLQGRGIPFDTPQYRCEPFLTVGAWWKMRFEKHGAKKYPTARFRNTDWRWMLADPVPGIARVVSKMFGRNPFRS